MTTFNVRLKLSDYQAHMMDLISQKTNIDTTNLIRLAIDQFIEKNLTEDDKKYFFEYKQRWAKVNDDEHKEWVAHWNKMNDKDKKRFDEVFKKGLEIAKRDPEFPYIWTHYVYTKELPSMESLPDIEWHRLGLLWLDKLTKDEMDLDSFKRIREPVGDHKNIIKKKR